ncbi:MAG: methionyl-tRNA formyltransferase [Planctomycetes bacterium]|nr:methionyl-tRNA formyltransferase [Planctomycetota bacterium]NOG54864.1 methionyl-tRNA formyltransferase [Planctomycetota bacterium]
MGHARPRIVFFGSGEFGLPTLQWLAANADAYDTALIVSQPARPAGRRRKVRDTPIAQWAADTGLPVITPANVNDPEVLGRIHAVGADIFVVIAFGQKLGQPLLADTFAINLHASLLPKYRGAAPINRAMMNGDDHTGLTVITLADRMDAGLILGNLSTAIQPHETAGELHDRLAAHGPELVRQVLERHGLDQLEPRSQDESAVTTAPKLRKEEGTVDFDEDSKLVRARIHGLNPWPGCTVRCIDPGDDTAEMILKIGRVADLPDSTTLVGPGTLLESNRIACRTGCVALREVQAPGGRMMTLDAFLQGHDLDQYLQLVPLTSD